MLADRARLPDDLDQDLASVSLLIELNFLNDQSQDLLAFLGQRCRCAPESGKVLGYGLESLVVLRLENDRIPLMPFAVLLLDRIGSSEPILPSPLKGTRHQTVFRFDGIILAAGTLSLVTCALAAQSKREFLNT
jgi:hypothetical protein